MHDRSATPAVAAPPTRAWLVLIVVLASIAAYANSLSGVFQFDDYKNILENNRIRDLHRLDYVLFYGRRPVLDLTLAVNYALGRRSGDFTDPKSQNPLGYHIVNIAVHVLAAMALFGVVRRTILLPRFKAWHAAAPWLALAIALLWAVHPLQTQCITYIIQRGEALMGLFYLLTLYCVLRGDGSTRAAWWYLGAIAASGLGMGSKAVMITAPAVVLLYDWMFLTGALRTTLRKRWWLYGCVALSWAVLWGVGEVHAIFFGARVGPATVGFAYHEITPWQYLATQPGVILHYLRLTLVPYRLCLDYDWPLAKTWLQIVPPTIVLVLLLLGTLWMLLRRSWIGFAGAWFFAILAPTSSFVPIKDIALEHRLYLPLAAIVALVVLGVYRGIVWARARGVLTVRNSRVLGSVLLAAATIVLAGMTVARNRVYASTLAMWRDVLDQHPTNARAWNGLGASLWAERRADDSIDALRHAVTFEPGQSRYWFDLGNVLFTQQRVPDALAAYEEAVRLRPGYYEAQLNRTIALLRLGRLREGIEAAQITLKLGPREAEAHYVLGRGLDASGRKAEARAEYQAALRYNPRHEGARRALDALNAAQPPP